jgi:hypothetical protein
MLLVLLALLGASVAFAQLLVSRSQTHALAKISWNFPPSFKILPLDNDEPEGIQIRAIGHPGGHERLLQGIIAELPARLTPQQQLDALQKLFTALSDAQPANPHPAPLAGFPGIELEGISDAGEFTLLRMITTEDHAIAICYSGVGNLTDWDRLYFNNVCQRVKLQSEPAQRK